MKEKWRIGCFLLVLCLILTACGKKDEDEKNQSVSGADSAAAQGREGSIWEDAFQSDNAALQETELRPTDFAGFTIGFKPGDETPLFENVEPVRTGETGIRFYEMPEKLVERTFHASGAVTLDGNIGLYKNGYYTYPLSVGPDGSVLWFGIMPVDTDMVRYAYFAFLQRDHEVLVVSVDESRGAGDEKGVLSEYISYLIREGRFGTFEWSPDGRYIFLNDISNWQGKGLITLPYLMDTHTGEVFLLYTRPDLDQDASVLRYPAEHPQRDNSHTCCTTWDGHFSRDGRYLYLILYSNLPDWETEKALMRWDLQSETMETCCWLDNNAATFAEMDDHQFLVSQRAEYTHIWQLVTGDETGFSAGPFMETVPISGSVRLYGGLSSSGVLVQYTDQQPLFFSVLRNESASRPCFHLLSSAADGTVSFEEISAEEAMIISKTRQVAPEKCPAVSFVLPVRNTPYVLFNIRKTIVGNESENATRRREWAILLLNTETMETKELLNSDTMIFVSGHEASASGAVFAGDRNAFRIFTEAPASPEPQD